MYEFYPTTNIKHYPARDVTEYIMVELKYKKEERNGRGYYLDVHPCELILTVKPLTPMLHFDRTGSSRLILAVTRKSAKAEAEALRIANAIKQQAVFEVCNKWGLALNQSLPPVIVR